MTLIYFYKGIGLGSQKCLGLMKVTLWPWFRIVFPVKQTQK